VEGRRPIEANRACVAGAVVRKARRDALLRDSFDALILAAMDVFFVLWPDAHIPLFDRGETMVVLALIHAIIIGGWIISRRFPAWRARLIARTWRDSERVRLVRNEAPVVVKRASGSRSGV
jgi:hypothetical protein